MNVWLSREVQEVQILGYENNSMPIIHSFQQQT